MKVWWCLEHKHPSDDAEQCYETDWIPCRMVERRLVSVDALVVEKVDGEWPEWAIDPDGVDYHHPNLWRDYLDALAEAQK